MRVQNQKFITTDFHNYLNLLQLEKHATLFTRMEKGNTVPSIEGMSILY